MQVGIENISAYTGPLFLNTEKLAKHRGETDQYIENTLMVKERSLFPVWEDSVTLAVNSAKPIVEAANKEDIGLLIVATETGLDQEKAVSTWVHRYLELPPTCRVFETKIACHAGAASLKMAESWIASGLNHGKKALIINVDISNNMMLRGKMEYGLGGGAISILISDQPDFFVLEHGKSGIHTHDVTDVIRPMPWKEVAFDVEASLYSYMDGLEYSLDAYADLFEGEVLPDHFDYNLYHLPFPGIGKEAHRTLLNVLGVFEKNEIKASYERKSEPAIYYSQRVGATYTGSIFFALLGLIGRSENVSAGERVGVYSYGSGSCAEFFSGTIGDEAKAIGQTACKVFEKLLDARRELSIDQYEVLEKEREELMKDENIDVDFQSHGHVFTSSYKDQGLLVLDNIEGHRRTYVFS